jgi:hypothetical protein
MPRYFLIIKSIAVTLVRIPHSPVFANPSYDQYYRQICNDLLLPLAPLDMANTNEHTRKKAMKDELDSTVECFHLCYRLAKAMT